MYQILSQYYDQLFTYSPKVKEFLSHFVTKDVNALDLGCGTGRLTHDLYDLGMNVIGIDLDHHMIDIAKAKYPYITFKELNMLHGFSNPPYELITCFGNTIPHLNKEELIEIFSLIQKHLSNQGFFIIQTLNYNRILKEKLKSLKPLQYENIHLSRNYQYYDDHIIFRTLLDDGKNVYENETKLYPYRYIDYKEVTDKFDLHVEVCGDLDFSPFNDQSYYMYLIINKKS